MRHRFERAISVAMILCGLHGCATPAPSGYEPSGKPSPEEALARLKAGNQRFVDGESLHPHLDRKRLIQASRVNQGDYAFATVIGCADSRVPVEIVFDVGLMDLFVIRVAGNVCNADECGCIEYGLAHVYTPLLVVLGHTQCGAVTAATHVVQGHGEHFERNIPALVNAIKPAVTRAVARRPDLKGDALIPYAVEENVYQGIEDLFMASPTCRELVENGKVKVLGAVYEMETGQVRWLPESKTRAILNAVSTDPKRAMKAMATE